MLPGYKIQTWTFTQYEPLIGIFGFSSSNVSSLGVIRYNTTCKNIVSETSAPAVVEQTTNLGLIIGVACGVGGFVFVVVVISVLMYIFCSIVCCFKIRTQINPKQTKPQRPEETDAPLPASKKI